MRGRGPTTWAPEKGNGSGLSDYGTTLRTNMDEFLENLKEIIHIDMYMKSSLNRSRWKTQGQIQRLKDKLDNVSMQKDWREPGPGQGSPRCVVVTRLEFLRICRALLFSSLPRCCNDTWLSSLDSRPNTKQHSQK